MSIDNNIGFPIIEVKRNSDENHHQNSDMSIGERVKLARKEAGLTQQELANKAGIKQSTLSELERGDSYGTKTLASMAAALSVNALWLEKGVGPKRTGEQSRDATPASSIERSFAEGLAELFVLFSDSNKEWRRSILEFARRAAAKSKPEEPPDPSE
jgi:transcriptional regulator with XRE-family HTH domain